MSVQVKSMRSAIRLGDTACVDMVGKMIGTLDRSAVIQFVVAYKNVWLFISAMGEIYTKATPEQLARAKYRSDNLDGLMEMMCDSYEAYDGFLGWIRAVTRWGLTAPGSRRKAAQGRALWFLFATLLVRAERIAEVNQQYRATIEEAWAHIIQQACRIRSLVEDNILWSEQELAWSGLKDRSISLVSDDQKAREFCANSMPSWLGESAAMRARLDSMGMVDWVSKGK